MLLAGLARDGGLYVPEAWPRMGPDEIAALAGLPYEEAALRVMRPYVGDAFGEDELRALIGRAYGRTVLTWFGKYLGVRAEQIHKIMDMFHHAEWFVIPFFVGSNIVAAISGIARVSARRLAVLLSIGLVVRLVFWWIIARIADDQIDTVLDFLNKYQTPALIASVVLTVIVVGVNLRRGRNFEL